MTKNTGGPAYPINRQTVVVNNDEFEGAIETYSGGMTLRDHFAGLAMQGVLAGTLTPDTLWSAEETAGIAYKVADAMLAEREKGNEN